MSDPRAGWAEGALKSELGSAAGWRCPAIRRPPLAQLNRLAAIGRHGDVVVALEDLIERLDVGRLVVDDQDAGVGQAGSSTTLMRPSRTARITSSAVRPRSAIFSGFSQMRIA